MIRQITACLRGEDLTQRALASVDQDRLGLLGCLGTPNHTPEVPIDLNRENTRAGPPDRLRVRPRSQVTLTLTQFYM